MKMFVDGGCIASGGLDGEDCVHEEVGGGHRVGRGAHGKEGGQSCSNDDQRHNRRDCFSHGVSLSSVNPRSVPQWPHFPSVTKERSSGRAVRSTTTE